MCYLLTSVCITERQFRETLKQAEALEKECEACSPPASDANPELLGLEKACEEYALRALDELLQKQEHELYSYKKMFAHARATYLSSRANDVPL